MPILLSGARKLVRSAEMKYRIASSDTRLLPDFIIVGAQKAGTTSMFYWLSKHPQLKASAAKEVHYFDGGLDSSIDNYAKGLSWYKAHFPKYTSLREGERVFEASPLYLFNPNAPKRIYELLPDVKIIVMLRNPIERAVSHYFHEKRRNREPLTLYEAIVTEEQRLRPYVDAGDYKNPIYIQHSYKSRGLYLEQLKRYLDYFPLKNILILSSEDFFREPEKCMKQVFEFVSVDPNYRLGHLKRMNVGSNRSAIEPEVYEYLKDYFSQPNADLYEFLSMDYGW
ncbi:sulfotransferase [Thiohalobacter thiocyanaticus]|uniref:Sulfotransferase n=2 Tax=Thiohalobacter thiocyanaticus TaxID=585455 RepID=A0A1Z4VNH8_9GAMM|nr:sulfotransferase [Thiohalobacter thiocyanaticus]